jgi:regulator of sigma E protease
MSVFIFIIILSLLVIIHELGHLLVAKWAKMKVEEFGLGYPPRAIKLFSWKETLFSLNWIPFGGFVKLSGEDELGGQFHKFSAVKRLMVILAGATMNFLYGILAFSIIFSVSGIPTTVDDPIIAQVIADSPAYKAGIKPGVKITAIKAGDDLKAIQTTNQVIEVINNHQGERVTIFTIGQCKDLVCEDNQKQYDQVYLRKSEEIPDNQGSMGVAFLPVIFKHYPWWQMPFRGMWYGTAQAFWLGGLILVSLRELVVNSFTLGQFPKDLAGPIGIVHQASNQGIFSEGLMAIISFSGMLSVNLGIMNILPIPALDGGRAFFIFVEKIIGKKKSQFIEHYANYAGYLVLLGLIIVVTIRDVLAII